MKFEDIKIGCRFIYNGKRFIKIHPIMRTCCEVKYNAVRKDGKQVKFNKNDEVEKIK